MLVDSVTINLRKPEDVHKFTVDFLTDPGFFTGLDKPITEHGRESPAVVRSATDLYQRLQSVLPPSEDIEDWPPYPYVRLELSFARAPRSCRRLRTMNKRRPASSGSTRS